MILTINGGSSSIKFAFYQAGEPFARRLDGKVDRIGVPGTVLSLRTGQGQPPREQPINGSDHRSAVTSLINCLEALPEFAAVQAIGHRVVHGMRFAEPELVTAELLTELRRIRPYDPDHLPQELELIEAFRSRHPSLRQIACFDTAFHRTMPRVAKLLPIPRRYEAQGVQRYGFHGLSYSYLMQELERVGGEKVARGRVILAHLGNGASLAAVKNGTSIDTTMGFTPTSGMPMSTRSGDLDPGLLSYLARTRQMTIEQFYAMVNHESGLLGISETSSDMRDLIARQGVDSRSAEAVELFCYSAKKWIGAFSAALGGLDTLVFSGGIGENCASVRKAICGDLGFLGVEVDDAFNAAHAEVISPPAGRVTVRVIRTNEELMIARFITRKINLTPTGLQT